STLNVIDGSREPETILDTLALSFTPNVLAVNSSTNRIYLGHPSDGRVEILGGAAYQRLGFFDLGSGAVPSRLAVDGLRQRVYVLVDTPVGQRLQVYEEANGPEGPPGSPTCSDAIDNDADGLVDLAHPDCGAPTVLSILPSDNELDVPIGANVVVTFSEPIDPSSVDPSGLVLRDPNGAAVPAGVGLSPNGLKAVLDPDAP